jgi:alginate biosynthesis protein Alg44
MNNGEKNQDEENRIRHKAEPTRHYPRYRIPAYVEIDGKRYKLKDWSVAGCAVTGLPEDYFSKKWTKANLVFPFDTFDAVIKNIKLEFIRRNPDGSIGCRFSDLNPAQVSLLQDIIESYLEGDIITLDDFINVIKREDLREAIEKYRPKPPERRGKEEFLRRIFILSLLSLTVFVLVVFLLEALKVRIYTVTSQSAFYDGKIEIVRTPLSGLFSSKKPLKPGDKVYKKQILGTVISPIGGSFIVFVPDNGTIVETFVKSGLAVREGDPILAILPEKAEIYVFANVLHKETKRLRVGQEVEIIDPQTGKTFFGVIEKVLTGPQKILGSLHEATPMPPYASPWMYDAIKIRFDYKKQGITYRDLGRSVYVKIDLTPPILKPILGLLP